MRKTQIRAGLGVFLIVLVFIAAAQIPAATAATQAAGGAPPPAAVTLTAPDGIKLKATHFPAGRPGPAVLLLHACNSDRSSWKTLATSAAARGYHVLAVDYRGYGESEGERYDSAQQRQQASEKWPADLDAAFVWLTLAAAIRESAEKKIKDLEKVS